MHFLIKNGVFNLPSRIKKIDKNYIIVFNNSNQKLEIHNKKQKNSYCLSCPKNILSGDIIKELKRTSVKNFSNLIEEISLNNEQIELNSIKQQNDYVKQKALNLMDYLSNSSKSANFFHF